MAIKVVLIDIAGTTTSIDYIQQTLFPYARQQLARYVKEHVQHQPLKEIITQAKSQLSSDASLAQVINLMQHWADENTNEPALKQLQGLIWQGGFYSGDLKGHVFPDVLGQLMRWHGQGIKMSIFSVGSIKAQQLLFEYSQLGDLTPLISAYFDTQQRPKDCSRSYQSISEQLGVNTNQMLYLSSSITQLDAAKLAGCEVIQINRNLHSSSQYHSVSSFTQIQLSDFEKPPFGIEPSDPQAC